jgi:phosphoribosyl-ATP pyrophosphohydrolase/phosphoribosyl-AMP cyclohydrolase
MIIPSIDLMGGRAVQLRQGRVMVLDGGDPLERLDQFAVAGEVAVVDLDAALGQGSNAAIIRTMVGRAACRVGGGIRDLDTARGWLDAGGRRVVIGTAATPAFCSALPRERVIAAVDSVRGEVVVDGWRTGTGQGVLDAVHSLAPYVGGFLLTQVEREGGMAGYDGDLVRSVVAAAGSARVTAAGGITTPAEIAELDRAGVDAQVGMALYTDRLMLADAIAAPLVERPDGLWPTVVSDESGRTLGLVWSSIASLRRAVAERRGIYWSRSRQAIWVKGESSGKTQRLIAVELDCDRDALRFVVHQEGSGFCHRGTSDCFGNRFSVTTLEQVIADRRVGADISSGTYKLLTDPALLASKLREEAVELAEAAQKHNVVHEAADVVYLMLVALARAGASFTEVEAELGRRNLSLSRRPMEAKP